ncbi:MAG: Glu-tRNA(Gln) amidotransferase subunit GatE [Nanoarchaeota archaeon]
MDEKIDYIKLGFKAGIEIHQQLDCGKLFCNCPGYLRSDEPDYSIKRRLHVVAGEGGEVDVAVKYEASLDKEFNYNVFRDNCCLIDLDEEPPREINEEALNEALKIALLLNCEIYPVTQVMRKTVIDGSNTSGFQRTVLIAHSGNVETSFGKVPIDTLCLEEDSARPGNSEEGDEKTRVWKLDRLGIPLIEIATSPVIQNPEQIKEAALKIGEILRVCKVKRGIGTIRQDINVSIRGHDRVEIKGFQDPAMMVETANKEIVRQLEEIKNGKTSGEVRGALSSGETKFNRPMPGKARMYPETDLPLMRIGRDKINTLRKGLPKLKHEIRDELKRKGLNDEMINLVLAGNVDEFNVLMNVYDKDSNLIAKMVTLWRNEFATKTKRKFEEIREILNEKVLERVLEELKQGKIGEGNVKGVLFKIVNGESIDEALKIEKGDDNLLEEEIRKIITEKPGLRAGGYMGLIIGKLGVGLDKKKAMEILRKLNIQ